MRKFFQKLLFVAALAVPSVALGQAVPESEQLRHLLAPFVGIKENYILVLEMRRMNPGLEIIVIPQAEGAKPNSLTIENPYSVDGDKKRNYQKLFEFYSGPDGAEFVAATNGVSCDFVKPGEISKCPVAHLPYIVLKQNDGRERIFHHFAYYLDSVFGWTVQGRTSGSQMSAHNKNYQEANLKAQQTVRAAPVDQVALINARLAWAESTIKLLTLVSDSEYLIQSTLHEMRKDLGLPIEEEHTPLINVMNLNANDLISLNQIKKVISESPRSEVFDTKFLPRIQAIEAQLSARIQIAADRFRRHDRELQTLVPADWSRIHASLKTAGVNL